MYCGALHTSGHIVSSERCVKCMNFKCLESMRRSVIMNDVIVAYFTCIINNTLAERQL